MIALIAFTRRGCELGKALAGKLGGTLYTTDRLAGACSLLPSGSLHAWTKARFADAEARVFIGAAGIAVRAVAPFVADKFSDPAVVSVDVAGGFAVPLLSGHVGGANQLARRIAAVTGGQAAISTATDVNACFAVDVWAKEQNLVICERAAAKAVSAAILEGRAVGIESAYPITGEMPCGLGAPGAQVGICIGPTAAQQPFETTLHLVPKAVTLGVGCRRGAGREQLEAALRDFLEVHALPLTSICTLASIELKQDEPGLLALAARHGWKTQFFSAEALASEPGDFPPSGFVARTTGVDNVCQRAAQRAGGTIIIPKTICQGVTFAAAMGHVKLHWEEQENMK